MSIFRIIIPILIILVVEYYAFIVVRSALRTLPSGWRIGIISLYFTLTGLSWAGVIFGRTINWAQMPHFVRNIYIAFAIGMIVGKLLILAVMLFDDLRRLVLWIINLFYTGGTKAPQVTEEIATTPSKGGITRSVFLARLALLLGGTALFGFMYGITNRYNYRIRRVKLSFKNLPDAFKGLKIVQISDIHTGSFDSHVAVKKGIQHVIDEKADLILFTGDLVNNKEEEVRGYEDLYSSLKAPMGVFSTLGNHDYGDYVEWPDKDDAHREKEKIAGRHLFTPLQQANLERLKQHHASFGWRLLMNEHIILDRGEDKIALVGIENWSAKANFPKYGDMRAAYTGLPEKNIPFKILLSHDPSHWDAQVVKDYKDVDLTLSGHTHGMQFGVEIPWLKWSPVQYVYKKWAGLYREGDQYLYVNRGFGFLGYPGRLGIMPEITVFELDKA